MIKVKLVAKKIDKLAIIHKKMLSLTLLFGKKLLNIGVLFGTIDIVFNVHQIY